MCVLQPLKCPHEAKEPFVSLKVTGPGVRLKWETPAAELFSS